MRTLTLNIPDNIELDDKEIFIIVAARLYEKGILSLGQAAELVGLPKRTFIEILGSYGVSIFSGYSLEDLKSDLKNA